MILHVDGDAFFVGCELSRRPDLRGKAVVTGEERGIVSALSYEAKALGVRRAYPIFKLRREFPSVVVLPGDYELYENYARRMYSVARRYSSRVEEYSIDECFAVLDSPKGNPSEERDVGLAFKQELQKELGMTFSVSIAPTKVLAKLASKRDKPDGFVYVAADRIAAELYDMSLDKVWGIGPSSLARLNLLGLKVVGDLAGRELAWLRLHFNLPIENIWRELRGEIVWPVGQGDTSKHKSISKTRTFGPATSDPGVLLGQLAKNIENAFAYARELGLSAQEADIFIKSEKYKYRTESVKFLAPIQTPEILLSRMHKILPSIIKIGEKYRSTGVTLVNLTEAKLSVDLFNEHVLSEKRLGAHQVADRLEVKYASRVLTLASSMSARSTRVGLSVKELPLPNLGDVW